MGEYSINFSRELITSASLLMGYGLDTIEKKQVVAYLCLLSSEISLKSALEKALIDVKIIRKCSHNFDELLSLCSRCEVEVEIVSGFREYVPATRIRAVVVDRAYQNATVGNILGGDHDGRSRYPSEIRYGNKLRHYDPELLLSAAKVTLKWVEDHWDSIRLSKMVNNLSYG